MKKIFSWMLIALVGIAFSSCEGFGKKQTEFYLSDLQGLWVQDGTQDHSRYTAENAGNVKPGYLWGRSWDEADDVHESDLVPYGNGWFMYRLAGNELLKIEQMDGEWADIPKRYTLTLLTGSKMTYHPKEYSKEKVSFTKQTE